MPGKVADELGKAATEPEIVTAELRKDTAPSSQKKLPKPGKVANETGKVPDDLSRDPDEHQKVGAALRIEAVKPGNKIVAL